MAASGVASVTYGQVENIFVSGKAEDLAIECLRVTLIGADTDFTIYCNHRTQSNIHTVAVRQALLVQVTPSNAAAYAEDVAKAAGIISKTTYTGDTVTVSGAATGIYDVLIIGRTP